jgi:type IX secretion system PorP/SprF family membrane protein
LYEKNSHPSTFYSHPELSKSAGRAFFSIRKCTFITQSGIVGIVQLYLSGVAELPQSVGEYCRSVFLPNLCGGAFDIGLFRENFNYSMIGLGLMVFNDVSGDGALTNLTMMGSLAYHQNMGGRGAHYFSVGIQGGLVQKSVDYNNLVFESQIGPNGVDPNLLSGEYGSDAFSYFDLNAGVNWRSRIGNNFAFQFGGAYHHLGEPSESFYSQVDNRLNARYSGYGSVKVGFDKVVFIPSALYMVQTQNSNEEITAGATVGVAMDKGGSFLYIGGHYRLDDAVIPSIGFDYNNIQFGLSYDINISDLSAVSSNKGGIELSLIYVGCLTKERKYTIDCPRFM